LRVADWGLAHLYLYGVRSISDFSFFPRERKKSSPEAAQSIIDFVFPYLKTKGYFLNGLPSLISPVNDLFFYPSALKERGSEFSERRSG
jgi:hypothetical protein